MINIHPSIKVVPKYFNPMLAQIIVKIIMAALLLPTILFSPSIFFTLYNCPSQIT